MSIGVSRTQTARTSGKLKKDTRGSKSTKEKSTAKELLKFAGTWKGDDLEKCLEEVYRTRGETAF